MQYIFLLVLLFIHESLNLKGFSVKTLAKNFKKINFDKNTQIPVTENDDFPGYPGDDAELIQKIQEEWEEYYNCLLDKKKSYETKQVKPEIRQLLEGQYTELDCSICKRPFQDFEQLEWKYKPLATDGNVTEFDSFDLPHQMVLTDEKKLQIYNAQTINSGIYVCFQGNATTSVYIIEISNDQKMINVTEDAVKVDKKGISSTQLQIYTEWSNWTECSACGTVGKMYKYGICMVTTEESLSLDTKNSEKEIEIIARFKTGIPCNSSLLPKNLQKYDQIRDQPAQVAVEFCKVPCPAPVVFEVVDPFGKLIETANNSAGIFSAFQKLPKLPPEVERRTVSGEFGGDIIIPCPGNLLTDTPYTWKVRNLTIISELIEAQSSGRITIDLINRLHIRRIRKKDSKTYSCWQRDKLAGTIFLEVEKKLKVRFDHHVILVSLILIIATILLIGLKVIARHRQRKQ